MITSEFRAKVLADSAKHFVSAQRHSLARLGWRALGFMAILLGIVLFAAESSAPVGAVAPIRKARPRSNEPGKLPADLVAAWETGGAQTGWLELCVARDNLLGGPDYRDTVLRFGEQQKEGEAPAFCLSEWRAGVLGRLPVPDREFGLSLRQVTSAGLTELAEMDSLQILDLRLARLLSPASNPSGS
jgi:hypothetical protein